MLLERRSLVVGFPGHLDPVESNNTGRRLVVASSTPGLEVEQPETNKLVRLGRLLVVGTKPHVSVEPRDVVVIIRGGHHPDVLVLVVVRTKGNGLGARVAVLELDVTEVPFDVVLDSSPGIRDREYWVWLGQLFLGSESGFQGDFR